VKEEFVNLGHPFICEEKTTGNQDPGDQRRIKIFQQEVKFW